jgi:hypothetical protein
VLSCRISKEEDADGKPDLSFTFDGCEPDTHRILRRGSLASFGWDHRQSPNKKFVFLQVDPGPILRPNRNTSSGIGAAASYVI